MIHEILAVGPLRCNCSIIADEASRDAIVIDPGDDIDDVMAIVRKHGLTVKQIVITHGHIDHVAGANKMKELTGAPILINEADSMQLKILAVQATWIGVRPPGSVHIDRAIKDGDTVQAGAITGNIIHTPGHTQGSVCLFIPAEKTLIAGDTLFAGSIGRTDLPGGDHKQILTSLHNQVLALPDDTLVIPGHGRNTTIGAERETNPYLQK